MIEILGASIQTFSNFIWGWPLLVLLIGGGLFFLLYSRLTPLLYIGHAVKLLLGTFDDPNEPGQINHYQALSTALAGTVGMGNISGVAIAITMGGPGAIFWMWVSALVGAATKFFTCSLAVMYRGKDDKGELQGGPMYVIREGLSKNWHFLAYAFAFLAMIGVSPLFQANQLAQAFKEIVLIPQGVQDSLYLDLGIGIVLALLVSVVVFGGIRRIGNVTGRLVPVMVLIYMLSVFYILATNYTEILPAFKLIIIDAFSGDAVLGGSVGGIIIMGVRRAAFSNEAGIGTAPMAHGAAKTKEPIREGLVAMLGPLIDTILVCTLTALAIIVTGVWTHSELSGISLTLSAFEQGIPYIGSYLLILSVIIFALSTMFAFPYYGTKSFSFLFGSKYKSSYIVVYVLLIPLGTMATLPTVISIFDSAYALMAFPTMISALLLAPKVKNAAKDYFGRLQKEKKFFK